MRPAVISGSSLLVRTRKTLFPVVIATKSACLRRRELCRRNGSALSTSSRSFSVLQKIEVPMRAVLAALFFCLLSGCSPPIDVAAAPTAYQGHMHRRHALPALADKAVTVGVPTRLYASEYDEGTATASGERFRPDGVVKANGEREV